jgi:hypothetical protein
MPYGGNDWLALTQEPTLEPALPICDAHHHFWDLRPERIPYQRYLLHELVADMHCGHNVRATVFIETRTMYRPDGPAELRPVGSRTCALRIMFRDRSPLWLRGCISRRSVPCHVFSSSSPSLLTCL